MHLIALLLARGHRVRGTLRKMAREQQLREVLSRQTAVDDRLQLLAADLEADAGWNEAASGMDGVFHVASPVPGKTPLEDRYFVGPARNGMLRVLEAARRAKVKRVVLTSSVAAITGGHACRNTPFSEQDWSIANRCPPYEKSKTLTERAAWDFIQAHADAPELAVINPAFVLGPTLWSETSPSLDIVRMLVFRMQSGVADLYFGIVDARDVAEAHYLAMVRPEARGQRFLCNSATLSHQEIAKILADYLVPSGMRVPTRVLPNWLVRVVSLFNPSVRFILPRLGQRKELDNSRLREQLGWRCRPVQETLRDTADSLLSAAL
jgi:nucleoside-diphosphate-sugar epimerase